MLKQLCMFAVSEEKVSKYKLGVKIFYFNPTHLYVACETELRIDARYSVYLVVRVYAGKLIGDLV